MEEEKVMLTETVLTLFNRVVDDIGMHMFYKTVMKCHWEEDLGKAVSASNTVASAIHNADCFVPYSEAPAGKAYVNPVMYQRDHEGKFTFAPEDVCYPYEIPGNEVLDRIGMKKLMKQYPDYFVIQKSANNSFGSPAMRHWEFHCMN